MHSKTNCPKYLTSVEKDRGKVTIEEYMDKVHFKHILFTEQYKLFFKDEFLKVIAITEFIKYYHNVNVVHFDGLLDEFSRDTIDRLIFPLKPELIVEPKSDCNYSVVHEADTIANKLFRGYCKKSDVDVKKYMDTLIMPDLNFYFKNMNNLSLLTNLDSKFAVQKALASNQSYR
ncbi:MAG: hypothetical protein WC758_02080 [Candidatus Woesearchaeota archaeon]